MGTLGKRKEGPLGYDNIGVIAIYQAAKNTPSDVVSEAEREYVGDNEKKRTQSTMLPMNDVMPNLLPYSSVSSLLIDQTLM